jgi:hypothetical protein
MTRRAGLAIVALALALGSGGAQAVFVVTEPWVRPAAAAGATDAYMQLMSAAGTRIIRVGSAVAGDASLVAAQGGALQSLPLPAGATVVLAPGLTRIRLTGLARALRLGDRVPLTLVIEAPDGTTQTIAVDAEVRRRSPTDDHRQPHRH